jgi:DNA-directed RNA polymerase subunit RPC12/RpoP
MTAGEPLFCGKCGRTFDVKLCPRLHVNPRSAEVCSQCGSRDLSMPHPKASPVWHVLEFLARTVIGLLIAYVTIAGLWELFTSPKMQNALLSLALLFIALWVLWEMVPAWVRKATHWSLKRGKRRES